ncbi:MAG: NAD(+)/NADH kinase [Lentisphaerae bacterium]|jgi:NAD+ kinase|nr:NAD(+)/NADH kinase [Lentisphaerota bacterium]
MKVAVILNRTIAGTDAALCELQSAASRFGIEIVEPDSGEAYDFNLVLGGDGSVLRAVHTTNSDAPLVNINIGSLGYLTCAGIDELDIVFSSLVEKTYEISERLMIRAEIFDGDDISLFPPAHALNDVVAMRGNSSRVVGLDLHVDGEDVTAFLCDGLIVATPTGSTAYSLSAGGPVVMPDTQALVLSVICPHTLTSRPLVLPTSCELIVRVSRACTPLNFSVDGQTGVPLCTGDYVKITESNKTVRLVMLPNYSPFATLRRKLNWRGTLL